MQPLSERMKHRYMVLLLLQLNANTTAASDLLPDNFMQAAPNIQLYMAYAEFKMAHYDVARQMWLHIDGKGAAEAAFNLGILYELGKGVAKDPRQAITYYQRAAEAGSRAAAYQIGLMYQQYPQWIAPDTAIRWLTQAALDGDTDAATLLASIQDPQQRQQDPLWQVRQLVSEGNNEQALALLTEMTQTEPPQSAAIAELAWMYETGNGVEQDIEQAGVLFLRAAKAGHARAQYAVAVMFETGVGQPKDPQQAAHWLALAAAQGYQPAVEKQPLRLKK